MPYTDDAIDRLFGFIDDSPTAYHAAAGVVQTLQKSGFTSFGDEKLNAGDRRYVLCGDSAVFAFAIGSLGLARGFRLIGAHMDGPGLKVKPNALRSQGKVQVMNTEVYGGPILHTWQDRPLSLAGQVALRGEDSFSPQLKLVDFKRPLLTLPSLAIHMDRDVNQSHKIDKAKALMPVLTLDESLADFETALAEILDVPRESIIDHALFLYDPTPACRLGLHQELIQAGRLDNLGMVQAALEALLAEPEHDAIHMVAFFDHEEVGSRTRQGASSTVLRDLMEKIVIRLGGGRQEFLDAIRRSFLISADQAHAVHPHFGDVADPTNRPQINGGPVLKTAASQSYVSELRAMAVFRELCREAKVPCQTFANRNDQRGGSTLGPLTIAQIPLPAVDVGNPIWAMHSIRETAGAADQASMIRVMRRFFGG